MNVFEAVKQNVTTRQAAELYGIRVGRNGMAVCPFHNDKNPSMKLDRRFHCFGCQADGDAVDFVSRLFGLPSKEAAMKINKNSFIYIAPKDERDDTIKIQLSDYENGISYVYTIPLIFAGNNEHSLDKFKENLSRLPNS